MRQSCGRFFSTTGSNMKTFLLSVLLVGFWSCAPPPLEVEPEWVDRACNDINDCGAVRVGEVCEQLCPNAAIHQDFNADYAARYDAAVAQCFPGPPRLDDGAGPCSAGAQCVDARCVLVEGD